MEKIKVIIEVLGGVAECTNQDQLPENIEVIIIDHDDENEDDQ